MDEQRPDYVQEVIIVKHSDHPKEDVLLKPDVGLMVLTWISFFVLLAILWKFAWKPILQGLDKREKDIKRSVDDADRIRHEMQHLEEKKQAILVETRRQSEKMVEEARAAARQAGKMIEDRARSQAQITLENAERDARDASGKAYAELKRQSADLIIGLTARLIRENMNEEKNKKLVNDLLKDI